ncbi:MAG: M56 family metallopeptidase [Verrucomicrobia bacterium]|nr:M56 family metallopeptidase [Verrucomicrobiota bacterium]MDA1069529.1 M56 family metallopeptidase [Verrucomicrobiota bacterium]
MNELYSILVIHLIESTDWAILFLAITWLFRIRDSRTRCWIYRLSILKFLIPTTLLASWFSFERSDHLLSTYLVSAEPLMSVVHYTTKQSFFAWPVYLWTCGFILIFLLTLLTGFRIHRRIRKNNAPFSGRHRSLLRQTLIQSGYSGNELEGTVVEQGPSLALYGIFRPGIIAKTAFLETLNDNELETALQHEAAHWMRRDNLWRLLTDAITAVLWFHPLVWFIRNRLTLETEKACDETVLAFGPKVDCYASCLLKAAEFSMEENHFGAIALSETSLKQRISHVIHYKKERVSIMKKSAIILTCLSLFGGSMVAFAETSPIEENRIYDISELDAPPAPTIRTAPVYPTKMKEEGVEGTVITLFVIDEYGNVTNPLVVNSSNSAFNGSAMDAVSQWKFEPGKVDGEPVRVRVRLPIKYTLQK